MSTLEDVVDLDRYGVHELESQAGGALVAACREELRGDGAVKLDGFLRPEAVARLVSEARELARLGYPNDERHNVYFSDVDESLPEDDPRRILVRSAQKAVAMDLLPAGFGARRLYESEEMTRLSPPCSTSSGCTAVPTRSTAAT